MSETKNRTHPVEVWLDRGTDAAILMRFLEVPSVGEIVIICPDMISLVQAMIVEVRQQPCELDGESSVYSAIAVSIGALKSVCDFGGIGLHEIQPTSAEGAAA